MSSQSSAKKKDKITSTMPSKLREVADYCWSNKFLDVFRNFFAEHGPEFEGAPLSLQGGEHNMHYYSLFQQYLKLYERTLEKHLQTLDISIEEFYREVRECKEESEDPYIQTFVDCLVASADYESFYKVMAREGAKVLAQKMFLKKPPVVAESKSESKSPERALKGGYGDEDGDKRSSKK